MSEFHFLRPYFLLLLLPLVAFIYRLWRKQTSPMNWQKYCDSTLLDYLLIKNTGRFSFVGLLGVLLAGAFSIIALAGPTYHKQLLPIYQPQTALVIALDLSTSMLATDASPSRYVQAKHKILDILQQRKEGQTALLVFAADAYTVTPLTDDTQTITSLVAGLSPEIMPAQGSRPDRALKKATQLLQQASNKQGHILLITDGFSEEAAKSWLDMGKIPYTLSIIGVGTPTAVPIKKEQGGFYNDVDGSIIMPKLDDNTLTQLAQHFSGVYHRITLDDTDLQSALHPMLDLDFATTLKKSEQLAEQWQELGSFLLPPVLIVSALAFRRGLLSLILVLPFVGYAKSGHADVWQNLWQTPDQQAEQAFSQKQYEQSAQHFNSPEWQSSAYYHAGQYQKALDSLNQVNTPDADYYRGNALTQLGQHEQAMKAFEQAYQSNPNNLDAKHNYEQIKSWLEARKQQQQQLSDSQPAQQDNKDSQNPQQNNNSPSEQETSANQQNQGSPSQQQKNQQPLHNVNNAGQTEKNSNNQDTSSTVQDTQGIEDSKEQLENTKAPVQKSTADTDRPTPHQQAKTSTLSDPSDEAEQALSQWLRQVPDDPGELLRRKFRYQYQRQQTSEEAQQW